MTATDAGAEERRTYKTKDDDVYKDDFSSDEEQPSRSERPQPPPREDTENRIQLGSLEASELVFENSIRDNFQMQEATDTMRKSKRFFSIALGLSPAITAFSFRPGAQAGDRVLKMGHPGAKK